MTRSRRSGGCDQAAAIAPTRTETPPALPRGLGCGLAWMSRSAVTPRTPRQTRQTRQTRHRLSPVAIQTTAVVGAARCATCCLLTAQNEELLAELEDLRREHEEKLEAALREHAQIIKEAEVRHVDELEEQRRECAQLLLSLKRELERDAPSSCHAVDQLQIKCAGIRLEDNDADEQLSQPRHAGTGCTQQVQRRISRLEVHFLMHWHM